MDITEAIEQRKSIRGFKSDPVSKEALTRILQLACRAPSASNSQPWEFVIMTGEVLSKIKRAMIEKLNNKEPMKPEIAMASSPNNSIFRNRQIELGKSLFELMNIPREDEKKRAAWLERGFRYFDAPVLILLLKEKSLKDASSMLGLGAVMQTICLAALKFGLGTCIENQGVLYPKVLRETAQISDNQEIVTAIAIGYPDWDFPANSLVSSRESLDNNSHWLGF